MFRLVSHCQRQLSCALPPQVELLVEVLDVNDESPGFTQPFGYAIPVSEGVAVPSVITSRVCEGVRGCNVRVMGVELYQLLLTGAG